MKRDVWGNFPHSPWILDMVNNDKNSVYQLLVCHSKHPGRKDWEGLSLQTTLSGLTCWNLRNKQLNPPLPPTSIKLQSNQPWSCWGTMSIHSQEGRYIDWLLVVLVIVWCQQCCSPFLLLFIYFVLPIIIIPYTLSTRKKKKYSSHHKGNKG